MPVEVDDELAAEQHEAIRALRHILDGPVSAEHIAQARHEHARAEGLRHIVLGAELDAGDDVRFLALRGHHHDRDRPGVLRLLEAAADLEAVDIGQHEVEHDEIRLLAAHHLEREAPAVDRARAHPGTLGVELDQLGDLGLVLNDQDLSLGGSLNGRHDA